MAWIKQTQLCCLLIYKIVFVPFYWYSQWYFLFTELSGLIYEEQRGAVGSVVARSYLTISHLYFFILISCSKGSVNPHFSLQLFHLLTHVLSEQNFVLLGIRFNIELPEWCWACTQDEQLSKSLVMNVVLQHLLKNICPIPSFN